jgi:2-polyprenyl-3-methyl-5-hydroxy-6-metoxy-1,4-benzoquinol methylase
MFTPVQRSKKAILHETMMQYMTTDFDRSGHPAIFVDLLDFQDIEPYQNSLDIIICAHVLEHIPEYEKACRI